MITPERLADLPFEGLIAEARKGSDVAAKIIVERYQGHVLQVIRRKMHRDMRQKFDSQDFVQAVWVSFFRNREELLEASEPAQLVGYLAAMARNKLIDETRRRLNTQKHDVRREQRLLSDIPDARIRNRDTPSEFAMANEAWEQIIDGTSDRDRRIAILRRNGEKVNSIAKQVGVSNRTVRRVLDRLENDSGP